ncbi:uncharacterized protein RAG0_06952 [Rhynchosporium agropyri]|uniref:Uncharacterized protein n=1 Tax=Rhynchosporium agropyri TaxID=914238 RepID=A0A1E1KJF8_9HELO|nr:uncharacterized protein RAG0_06952 [Rhynchosporium agropyri]
MNLSYEQRRKFDSRHTDTCAEGSETQNIQKDNEWTTENKQLELEQNKSGNDTTQHSDHQDRQPSEIFGFWTLSISKAYASHLPYCQYVKPVKPVKCSFDSSQPTTCRPRSDTDTPQDNSKTSHVFHGRFQGARTRAWLDCSALKPC